MTTLGHDNAGGRVAMGNERVLQAVNDLLHAQGTEAFALNGIAFAQFGAAIGIFQQPGK